jgi:hypothetical protein
MLMLFFEDAHKKSLFHRRCSKNQCMGTMSTFDGEGPAACPFWTSKKPRDAYQGQVFCTALSHIPLPLGRRRIGVARGHFSFIVSSIAPEGKVCLVKYLALVYGFGEAPGEHVRARAPIVGCRNEHYNRSCGRAPCPPRQCPAYAAVESEQPQGPVARAQRDIERRPPIP